VATIDMGRKERGVLCPFRRELGPNLNPYSRLATIDMGQKLGGGWCAFFSGGSSVPIEHKVTCAEAYIHTKWHHSPSNPTTDIGQKLVGLCPFRGGEAGSLSNTMSRSRRPRPTAVTSGMLIHAAVWPQQMWAENWGLRPFLARRLGPHLTQSHLG